MSGRALTRYEVTGIVAGITIDKHLGRFVYELAGTPIVLTRLDDLQDNVGIGTVVRAVTEYDPGWDFHGVQFHFPVGRVEDADASAGVYGHLPRTMEVLAAARSWPGRRRPRQMPVHPIEHGTKLVDAKRPVTITEETTARDLAATIVAAHLDVRGEAYLRAIDDTEQAVRALVDQLDGADPNRLSIPDGQVVVIAWLTAAADDVGAPQDTEDTKQILDESDPNIRLTGIEGVFLTDEQVRAQTLSRLAVLTHGAVTLDSDIDARVGDVVRVPVSVGDAAWTHAPGRRFEADGTTTARGVVVSIVEQFTTTGADRHTVARTVTAQPAAAEA